MPEKFHGLWLPAFHDRKFPRYDGRGQIALFQAAFVFGVEGFYVRMVAGGPEAGLAPLFSLPSASCFAM
ncbi:hypothetical protein AGR1C_Cc10571 [Agrobacterium fabacearum TT111]|nr:hypothetical protein AGR1C_Cc10571 [Agrobacterium fabacearum TT111]